VGRDRVRRDDHVRPALLDRREEPAARDPVQEELSERPGRRRACEEKVLRVEDPVHAPTAKRAAELVFGDALNGAAEHIERVDDLDGALGVARCEAVRERACRNLVTGAHARGQDQHAGHVSRLDAYWGVRGDASDQAAGLWRVKPVAVTTGKTDAAQTRRVRRTSRGYPQMRIKPLNHAVRRSHEDAVLGSPTCRSTTTSV